MTEPQMDPRFGPDGHPLPGTSEEVRLGLYDELVAWGLSDPEARGTVWPEPSDD